MDFRMDPFDDIVSDNAAKNARPSGKFQPKAKVKPRKESSVSVQSTWCTKAVIDSENERKNAALENSVDGIVVVPPPDNRSSGLTNRPTEHLSDKKKGDIGSLSEVSDSFLSQNTILTETQTTYADMSRKDEVILGTACEARLDHGLRPCNSSSFRLAAELPVSLDPLIHEEFTSSTAEDLNKMFEIEEGNTAPCLETLSNTDDVPSVPSQTVDLDEGSLPTNVPAKERGQGTTNMRLDHSVNHQQPSTSGQGVECGRSLKRLCKQMHIYQLVDELEEEDIETCQFPAEYPIGSSVNEDDHSDKDYQLEDERQNKKVSGKSKNPGHQEKANEASIPLTKKPSKKFSHSTRRRGRFEKGWLKIPEDEIEISDLSLKEIIVLGEYRELTERKNQETSQVPVRNQSTSKSSSGYFEDDDVFASEQGQESNDEQEKVAVQDNDTYFNYHANMKRTTRGRWTNQDTELFYEGLQQFGTDLTMIAQLFPGRTRDHIKLKYKNEERKHPLRLNDALANRGRGHSHFEQIVNRVKKAVAKRKRNFNIDDLDGLSGEEWNEVPPETNEVPKHEKMEQSEVEHMEDDVPEATDPVECTDSEDDEERWSQFRSDL
ncbi:hypothetical protein POM88_012707 [Heracleum sosnowskyi]|uniref:HTH myb-type domain-containing protein n=1 Tax=Heracleum sosnowskyi TaxID=360622 RepID=A0AAD8IXW4_9APIA|nr:hypothetical protein POM88_012707 [Heracleum sosnowskyi]